MSPTVAAARAGIARGWIEFRNWTSSREEVLGALFPNLILIIVMLFMRGGTVPGTTFSLGSVVLVGVLGMGVATGGLMTMSSTLTTEREDGTLLRAKAVPGGMLGYLIGKTVCVSIITAAATLVMLVIGLLIFDGLAFDSPGDWLLFAAVLLLGLAATMPIGAIIGSLFSSARSMGLVFLPITGLVAISGIFYPITALPEWLQWIGQVFPIYWLGLGMRSALLPDPLQAVEIAHSWRHLETLGVLGAWVVIGVTLAPVLLRRMARRESGSAVEARKQKAMQQVR